MALCIFYLFLIAQVLLNVSADNSVVLDYSNLKSIHVLFRHGDRAPDIGLDELFPKDPYYNYTYYPFGRGALTNSGKLRLYDFGNLLRERYDSFLGDFYWAPDVEAQSTHYKRTKMSVELVLASLFPPKGEQKWSDNLNWQPIPYESQPKEKNQYFVNLNCPAYLKEIKRVRQTNDHIKQLKKINNLMENLTNLTGKKFDNTEKIYYLYHTLTAQKFLNLSLSNWTEPYFSNGEIANATLIEYDVMSFNDKLKRLNGGMSLKKILDDTSNVVNKTIEHQSAPKVHLYAAHECNVAAVLITLDLWKNEIPQYTSSVIFELYEKDSEYYIKIIYYHGEPKNFEDQKLPGCDVYCPYEKFLKITEKFIPIDVEQECVFGF